ncbi:MAG TPA: calcium/sodium antiporter [Gemmatimonadota bacterium]|nr:calcium/sodium antiporter [Gemmatimonadota bacterium]
MLTALLILIVGVLCLFAGGHLLVRGASQLALRLELSPLFIGLTVVAFGTSLPELMVTFLADLRGAPEIAVGNVVGSNIANLGLVLGTAALVAPLSLHSTKIVRDLAISIAATVIVALLALNGHLGRAEGVALLLGLTAYVLWSYRGATTTAEISLETMLSVIPALYALVRQPGVVRSTLMVTVGLAVLLAGANWAIDGAVEVADLAGLRTEVVGLTIVAVGTSLPELTTSVVAAWKRESDISIGNILGSNVFNLFGILGVSATTKPLTIAPHILSYDLPIVVGFSLLCLPMVMTGRRISRGEGLLLLVCYIAYCGWLYVLRG